MTDPVTDPMPQPDGVPTQPVARGSSRALSALLVTAIIVAAAGIAFAAGRLTAPAAASITQLPGGGQIPRGGPGASFVPGGGQLGGLAGGVTLRGEVTAVSADSMTITLEDGSSVTVPLDTQTAYHIAAPSSASAVSVGDSVVVQPGAVSGTPGASFGPGNGPATVRFGPARDVTVVDD